MTTSPIQSNPVTNIIDMALKSIKDQPSLEGISITIVCDGVKVTESSYSKYKSGIVSVQSLENYEVYKKNLKEKYQHDKDITII